MRVVAQRVSEGAVLVNGQTIGAIARGLVVLAGFAPGDSDEAVEWCADKLVRLRIFADADGKMNKSIQDVGGAILVVSQFTLYGSVRRGLRPDFGGAAPLELARPLYEQFIQRLGHSGLTVQTGQFGAHMEVRIVNDGPVTFYIDTDEVMPHGVRRVSDGAGDA